MGPAGWPQDHFSGAVSILGYLISVRLFVCPGHRLVHGMLISPALTRVPALGVPRVDRDRGSTRWVGSEAGGQGFRDSQGSPESSLRAGIGVWTERRGEPCKEGSDGG